MSRQSDRIRERIAEEAQLLAEEKWIIEALTKIKNQRNCLQIERLQLESLESKLKQKLSEKCSDNRSYTQTQKCSDNQSHTQTQHKIQQPPQVSHTCTTRNSIEFEVPIISGPIQNMDLDTCNDEELDLVVSKSVFSQEFKKNILEEDEEEDDDDMFIDMNMFMNAKNSFGN